jgi:hypothetical protein
MPSMKNSNQQLDGEPIREGESSQSSAAKK